jgi:hypothetical protein
LYVNQPKPKKNFFFYLLILQYLFLILSSYFLKSLKTQALFFLFGFLTNNLNLLLVYFKPKKNHPSFISKLLKIKLKYSNSLLNESPRLHSTSVIVSSKFNEENPHDSTSKSPLNDKTLNKAPNVMILDSNNLLLYLLQLPISYSLNSVSYTINLTPPPFYHYIHSLHPNSISLKEKILNPNHLLHKSKHP